MTTASFNDEIFFEDRRERHVSSRETNWGVIVTELRGDKKSLAMSETVLRLAGLLVVLLGGALPLMSDAYETPGPTPILPVLGLAAACTLIGFSLHRYGRTGLRSELRIDVRFGWLFLGSVNSDEDFTSKRAIQRRDVDGLFIERKKPDAAKLCVQLKDGSQKVVAMVGPEEELIAPLKRAFETLFGERMPERRAITRVEGDRIHASFA